MCMITVVSPAFRVESVFCFRNPGAEAFQHCSDYAVATDPDMIGPDLCRKVAVSHVPDKCQEMMWICPADLVERFRCGKHFDNPSVLEFEPFTVPQQTHRRQVEQETNPVVGQQRDATPASGGFIKRDRVSGLPGPRWKDF